MIYLIRCTETGLCKIGHSVDPAKRLATLQVGSPTRLELLFAIPGDAGRERELHVEYQPLHSHGEWYALLDQDIRAIHSTYQETFDEPPVVKGRLRPGAQHGFMVEIRCPYCGVVHVHGAGPDGSDADGHREAHCADWELRQARGHSLMTDMEVRKICSHGYIIQVSKSPP